MQYIRYFFIDYGDMFFKIIVCMFLTGIIGFNREKNGMTVGVRTHVLVGLCAVLLQITSLDYANQTGYQGDIFRLNGQMLSGLGFLCGGAIIKGSKHVRGLTTATSLFFVACIGLSVGAGMYVPAITITTIGFLFLIDAFKLKSLVRINKSLTVTLGLELSGSYSDSAKEITESLDDLDVEIESIDITTMSMEKSKITMKLKTNDETDINAIVDSLMSVKSITRTEVIKKY